MDASTSDPLAKEYNQVSGRVFVTETSVGIPNLVVSLFNVAVTSESTSPPNGESTDIAGGPSEILAHHLGRRIGSVITESNGLFEIGFGDRDAWGGVANARPSLLLLVTGPELSGSRPCRNLLHASCDIRIEAGRLESYAVAISRAQLEAAGVLVPMVEGRQVGPMPFSSAWSASARR
jgi:hypothetical protein